MKKEKGFFLNEKIIEKCNINISIEEIDIIRKQMQESVCQIKKDDEKGTGFFCEFIYNNKKGDEQIMNT